MDKQNNKEEPLGFDPLGIFHFEFQDMKGTQMVTAKDLLNGQLSINTHENNLKHDEESLIKH